MLVYYDHMRYPLVSIIITTKNSSGTLEALLKSIKEQTYKSIEIIIVDNFSSDRTMEIAKEYTSKVFQKGPERSVQRNFGALKAKGKYLFILDSDMILEKNVVTECVEKCEKENRGGIVIGGLIVPEKSFGKGIWAKAKILEREINRNYEYFEAARFFPKRIFQTIGGYDKDLTGPEDWDLPRRIKKNYLVGRVKSYILHNERNQTFLDLAKRKYYYGLSVHKYLTKQNIPILSPVTVYFLRPAFYYNWKKILAHPKITLGMIIMLIAETVGGGLGYLIGRFKSEK